MPPSTVYVHGIAIRLDALHKHYNRNFRSQHCRRPVFPIYLSYIYGIHASIAAVPAAFAVHAGT